MAAAYLINRLPSRVLGFKSPIKVMKGRKVDISHLRVFGCICFVHVQPHHRDKLDPRAVKCIFLGYASTQKGYKCYNPQLRKMIVSKDVRFQETNPFYSKLLETTSQGECVLDLFPLPRIELNMPYASTNKSLSPINNDVPFTESNNEATQSDETLHEDGDNQDGSIERHKVRLVARGFTQTFEVDYKETFAPVAKMNSVRVLLSVAVNKGWSMYQMDVKNAFLHGDLEEEVYMKLPPGHPQNNEPDLVCKLHKSIYGLKQSPRAWYAKLSSVLQSIGFKRSNADSSLFVRTGAVGKLVVLIYVDDLIITGDNAEEISKLKQSLQQRFAIKDLGVLKYFLGIEMATSHKGLFLNQRKYVLDLLKEANMNNAKPAITPLDSKLKLSLEGTPLTNISYYQRLVGKLIYLTITRPDITYSVSIASQLMQSPTVKHLNLVKRILRYLKGSVGRDIIMKKNENTQIIGYCDADWAGNAIDRKSTTGYCTFVGGNLVT
ncbi:unnamed protein product [Prunus armeniaca]